MRIVDTSSERRAEWLDGRSVVFGKLVVGYDLLLRMAKKYERAPNACFCDMLQEYLVFIEKERARAR